MKNISMTETIHIFQRSSLKGAFQHNKSSVADGDCSDCVALEVKWSQNATSFVGLCLWLICLMLVQEEKETDKPFIVSWSSLSTISVYQFVYFQHCTVQEECLPFFPQKRLLASASDDHYT